MRPHPNGATGRTLAITSKATRGSATIAIAASDGTASETILRLSKDDHQRLDRLVAQISCSLRREVTRAAVLRVLMAHALTWAEAQPDLARKVRDGASPPWKARSRIVKPKGAQPLCAPGDSPLLPKKGSLRDLGRRGQ